jgi:uncharacterized membrane protein YgcG/uncharacterized protein YjbJ (UPF0337 family)
MNSKNSKLKKFLTSIVVFGLVFGPALTTFSQTNAWDNVDEDAWWPPTSGTTGGGSTDGALNLGNLTGGNLTLSGFDEASANSTQSDPDLTLKDRSNKDSQADQKEAQALEQKQKSDEDECNKQGGGLGGASNPLSQAVQPAMEQAVQETIQQGIKKSIPAAIEKGVQESVPKIVNSALKEKLPALIQNQLPTNLQNRLTQERAVGTDLSNNNILDAIVKDEFNKTLNNGIPGILSQSLSSNLPAALSQYLQGNLSDLISQNVSANLPANIQDNLSQALSSGDISDQIDSALRSALEESGSSLSEQVISSIDANAFSQISDQLTGAITQNMGSITDSITSGLAENLSGTLNDLGSTLSAGLTDSITNSLTGQLDSVINQLSSSLTDPLNQALSGITDQLNGTINEMMGSIMDPINGMMDDMMSSIMDPITGMMDDMMSSIMDPITGMMDDMMSSIMDPITGMMDDMMSSIMSPVTDMMNNITGKIAETVGDTVGAAVGDTVGAAVGDTVGGAVGNTLGGGVGGIAGGVVGGLIGGGFVPVKEQNGPLLKATKSIDSTTDEIKKLTVEICKHTKSIKRVQQAFEEKEFVADAEATREARTKTEQYRQGMSKMLEQGYDSTGSGADSPLYVKDTATQINSVREEQYNVFQTQLKDSENDYVDSIRQTLEKDNNASDLDAIKPTLEKSAKDKLLQDPTSMESGEDFYDALIKYGEMRNNPTSVLLAQDALNQRQVKAEQNAREEIQAGSGYLPTRKCVEKVGEYCAKYETVTPAITIKDASSKSMNARVDEYIQAREASDIAQGNEPQVNEIATMKPSTSGGGASNGASSGGGSGGGFDLSSLIGLFQGQGGGSSGGGGLDLSSILNLLQGGGLDLSSLTGGQTSKPTVSISLTKTSASSAQIKWTVGGTAVCKANNDWYSLDSTNNETQIIKASGSTVGSGTNSLNIKIPIPATTVKLKIKQNAQIYEIGTSVITRADGLAKETDFSLTADEIYKPQVGDVYTLEYGNQSVSYTNKTDKVADGITGLSTATKALGTSSEAGKKFSQLKIVFSASAGKITVSLITNYKIKCTGAGGSAEAQTNQ